MWNQDEIKGKMKKVKGKAKDKAGEVLGNQQLEEEGEADYLEGSIQEGAGKLRRKVGEAVEDVGKAVGGKE
jgi:uncharacterized protein YjbJ (UPF0337 family)